MWLRPRHASSGSVVLSSVDDKKSPITYGYDDKPILYFRQGPIITVGGFAAVLERWGRGEKQAVAPHVQRRGTASDPTSFRRTYAAPEKPVSAHRGAGTLCAGRTDRSGPLGASAKDQQPRVVLRFAAEKTCC